MTRVPLSTSAPELPKTGDELQGRKESIRDDSGTHGPLGADSGARSTPLDTVPSVHRTAS